MQENNINAKCPHCGAELYVRYSTGEGFCTVCRKPFDNAKAVKLYSAILQEEKTEQEKKASFGEEYLELDRILNRAEYYFERNDFISAKEELEKGLKISTSDYRLYFGLVRVETKNLTDYKNTTHTQYLNKAIECADVEEKSVIMRLYKDFYQLSSLTEEEILQYKTEENVAIKAKLEKKFKEQIPFYIKKEGRIKPMLIAGLSLIGVSLAFVVLFFALKFEIFLALGATAMLVSYILCRNSYTTKKIVTLFNALLDLYDQFDNFYLSEPSKREVLDSMKLCRKSFAEKNNLINCEEAVSKLLKVFVTQGGENARRYVLSHKELSKHYSAYEESEDQNDL